MKFAVLVFPGSNCDQDCYHVAKNVMGQPTDYVWHKNKSAELEKYDCIIIPGGFSYGDYLRAGAIARFAPVMKKVADYAVSGGLIIGICNGFQILLEAGLLPGAMLHNQNLNFKCKYVNLRVENNNTSFTADMEKEEIVNIPIAHKEGNYFIDKNGLKKLEENNQIILRYVNDKGEAVTSANPNGSVDNIAGITNKKGNVFGLMPHPERASEAILGNGSCDGRKFFQSILKSGGVRV
ncbi:MAG: phosphoribosylformylglycinamidine synthase subunit PurQ [Halanaerobiaceae bacterium]